MNLRNKFLLSASLPLPLRNYPNTGIFKNREIIEVYGVC